MVTLAGPRGGLAQLQSQGRVRSLDIGRGMLGLPNNNILHRRHVRVSWVDNAWCAQTLGKNKVVVVRADRGVSGSEKREIVPHAPYCAVLGSKLARDCGPEPRGVIRPTVAEPVQAANTRRNH